MSWFPALLLSTQFFISLFLSNLKLIKKITEKRCEVQTQDFRHGASQGGVDTGSKVLVKTPGST